VALVAAVAAYLIHRWNGKSDGTLAFSGNVELTEVKISFKTAGRLVELLVKEGDTVTKGMVIARLDRDQLLSQREAQRAVLASAQSLLAQLLTSVDYQREMLEGGLASSKADFEQADARLRELLADRAVRRFNWRERPSRRPAPIKAGRPTTGSAPRRSTRTTTSRPRSTTSSACSTSAPPRF